MAKTDAQKKREREEFEQYVRDSSDQEFKEMLEVAELQKNHPDFMNICWAGSPHNIPIPDVLSILDAETRRRKGRQNG